MVYARMASIDDSPGGSYAYARRAFGPFIGYQTTPRYWLAGWIGNVALAVVGVGYLSFFFPILKEPMVLAAACVGMIWRFTFINILGPKLATNVQSVTTSLALVAIVGVAVVGWFKFSPAAYMGAWNVSGKDTFGATQGVLNLPLDDCTPSIAPHYPGLGLADLAKNMQSHMRASVLLQSQGRAFTALPRMELTLTDCYQNLVANEVVRIGLDEAAGRTAATGIVPYPQGIPMAMPGENLGSADEPFLSYLLAIQDWDRRFPGFAHDTHGIESELCPTGTDLH